MEGGSCGPYEQSAFADAKKGEEGGFFTIKMSRWGEDARGGRKKRGSLGGEGTTSKDAFGRR